MHRCDASNKLRVKSPGHLKTTYIRALMDAFGVGVHSEGVPVKLWCTFRFMSVSCSLCLCVGPVVTGNVAYHPWLVHVHVSLTMIKMRCAAFLVTHLSKRFLLLAWSYCCVLPYRN